MKLKKNPGWLGNWETRCVSKEHHMSQNWSKANQLLLILHTNKVLPKIMVLVITAKQWSALEENGLVITTKQWQQILWFTVQGALLCKSERTPRSKCILQEMVTFLLHVPWVQCVYVACMQLCNVCFSFTAWMWYVQLVSMPVCLGTASFQTLQIHKPPREFSATSVTTKGSHHRHWKKRPATWAGATCWISLFLVLCSPTILPVPSPRRDSRAKRNGYRNKHVN